jgi:hypothetical protein
MSEGYVAMAGRTSRSASLGGRDPAPKRWREDNRRVTNGEQYLMAANAALAHPVSRQWKGYSQRAF